MEQSSLSVILLLALFSRSSQILSKGPMFHYVFENCEERVNHYVFKYFEPTLYRLINASFMAYDTDNPQFENISKIVVSLTDDLLFWSKTFNMANLNDSELIYPLMDLKGTSNVEGNTSAILFAIDDEKKKIFYQTYKVQNWRPDPNCLDCLESNTPLPYISVMRDEPNKNWLSLNDKGSLISSKDGKQWENFADIKLAVPDYRFIEEIFSISVFGEPSNVKWVMYLKNRDAKENYYYIFTIQNGSVKLESPKTIFDYGHDFDELAINTGSDKDEYGPQFRLAIGSITGQYTGEGQCPFKHVASWARIITLLKVNGSLLLSQASKPYPKQSRNLISKKPNITLAIFEQGKTVGDLKEKMKTVRGQHYVLNCTISFGPGSKFWFEILSNGDRKTVVSFDSDDGILTVDRSKSSNLIRNVDYDKVISAEVRYPVNENKLLFEFVVDRNVVEVIVNKCTSVTVMVFPDDDENMMAILANNDQITVEQLGVYQFSMN